MGECTAGGFPCNSLGGCVGLGGQVLVKRASSSSAGKSSKDGR